jgi:hypothetical protein
MQFPHRALSSTPRKWTTPAQLTSRSSSPVRQDDGTGGLVGCHAACAWRVPIRGSGWVEVCEARCVVLAKPIVVLVAHLSNDGGADLSLRPAALVLALVPFLALVPPRHWHFHAVRCFGRAHQAVPVSGAGGARVTRRRQRPRTIQPEQAVGARPASTSTVRPTPPPPPPPPPLPPPPLAPHHHPNSRQWRRGVACLIYLVTTLCQYIIINVARAMQQARHALLRRTASVVQARRLSSPRIRFAARLQLAEATGHAACFVAV